MNIDESYLKKLEKEVENDFLDAIRYMTYGLYPNTATGKDLDRLMELGYWPPQSAVKNQCDHSWKTYEGLTNRFDFCEKCDEKRT